MKTRFFWIPVLALTLGLGLASCQSSDDHMMKDDSMMEDDDGMMDDGMKDDGMMEDDGMMDKG